MIAIIKTHKKPESLDFMQATNKRIAVNASFYEGSGVRVDITKDDPDRYTFLIYLSGFISLPRSLIHFVAKRGLRKAGYKGSINTLNKTQIEAVLMGEIWGKPKYSTN